MLTPKTKIVTNLAAILGMLNVEIITLGEPLQPFDSDHALPIIFAVSLMRHNGNGLFRQEAFAENCHAGAGNGHGRHIGVNLNSQIVT